MIIDYKSLGLKRAEDEVIKKKVPKVGRIKSKSAQRANGLTGSTYEKMPKVGSDRIHRRDTEGTEERYFCFPYLKLLKDRFYTGTKKRGR